MEAGRNLLSSYPPFPPKPRLRNSPPPSVTMLHDIAAPAVASMSTTSLTRQFPASVLLQEQRDDFRSFLHIIEDKTSQAAQDRRQTGYDASSVQETNDCKSDQYLEVFQRQLLNWPDLWHLLPSPQTGEKPLSMCMQSTASNTDKVVNTIASDAVALARKVVSASKQLAFLSQESNSSVDDFVQFIPDSGLTNPSLLEKGIVVRSKRLLERRSKKRKVANQKAISDENPILRKTSKQRKRNASFDPSDPLRLFLSGATTKQLLTAKEESELLVHVKELTRLEEVKHMLQSQFGREPTLVEWAEAVDMSCRTLQSRIHLGSSSRERMICSNFRMVVHIAKSYQGRGLNLQDLMQEGSRGLIRSLEKFKPTAGCRFSSYAYWWIRQSIRKAIFKNSRIIRLPENVYDVMRHVRRVKDLLIKEGHQPTNVEVARRVGMSVEKLEMLYVSTRLPISMQQKVWADQDATLQEITADTAMETPSISVAKQVMRRHVQSLLTVLPVRERRIIRLRFGLEDGQQKSLSQIGDVFGLSKERVRQLESRSLEKLRTSLSVEGLQAYVELIT